MGLEINKVIRASKGKEGKKMYYVADNEGRLYGHDILNFEDARAVLENAVAQMTEEEVKSLEPEIVATGMGYSVWMYNCGGGEEMLFEDKDEAIAWAKKEWNHADRRDKRNYAKDPEGGFEVRELEVFYDDVSEEMVADHSNYNVVWDALKEGE